MFREFARRLNDFVGDRQLEADARLRRCPRYQEAGREIQAVEQEIRSRLGPEGRDLFNRWDFATGMQMGMAADEYYVQGLRDGLALAVFLAAPGGRTFYAMIEETRRECLQQEQEELDNLQ